MYRVDVKPKEWSYDWLEHALLLVCQRAFPSRSTLRIEAIYPRLSRISPHKDYCFTLSSSDATFHLVLRLHYGIFSIWGGTEPIKITKEYSIMRHVYQHGFATPFPFTFGVSEIPFGHPYILFDPGDGVNWWENDSLHHVQKECVESMAEELAKLHKLVEVQHSQLPKVDVYSVVQNLKHRATHVENKELQQCFRGCELQMKDLAGWTPVLLHGEYDLDNILIKDGVVRSVCNWEYAAVGDPRWDVAHTSLTLQRKHDHSLANRFVSRYVQLTNVPMENLAFWEGLIALRSFALSQWLRTLSTRSFESIAGLKTPLFDQEAENRTRALEQFG
ncbi:MAG: phosphotransferase family protein [bacterium]